MGSLPRPTDVLDLMVAQHAAQLERDLADLRAAVDRSGPARRVPARGGAQRPCRNRFYATDQEFWEAAGEALRTEYLAILDAGFVARSNPVTRVTSTNTICGRTSRCPTARGCCPA